MLQDVSSLKPGTIVGTYGNSALWSLSYEWWFYMIFIPVSKFKNKNFLATFIVVMSSLMYFLYPIQIFRWLMYFGIWWSGVILADLYLKENLNLKNIITAIVIPILLVPSLLLIIKIFDKPLNSIGVYPVLDVRHFISAIFFIILALIWKNINWIGYNFLKPLEKLAPFSYGLYVLHLPLILVLEPIISKYIENGFIQFIIISFLVLLISYILETKFQKKINQLLYKN
jgi:peptidoglycan/LPS O-acetylase OafA/YrhL